MSFALISQASRSDDKTAIRTAVTTAVADPAVTRLLVEPRVAERVAPTIADESDTFFAQVLAALMLAERLDVEVALLPAEATGASTRYGLPHGPAARELAEHGTATSVPLIRDDAATVLLGRARHLGAEGAKLHGETYVDSERLFRGEVRSVLIEPTLALPGLRAQVERLLLPGRWLTGRAAQTGGTNIVVEREGVVNPRVVKRSTFYRHDTDLRLVRP
ncbi:hypothetical protein VX037_16630 [Gordonia sp. Z-3]|uniref:Uncharacterized protein n=2 Tax=Gordonia TaxID=2053 RepID=A0A9X3D172_9ACTN|nr:MULTISPECIES: hypothetical protein [Gordonia]MAU82339.1 hypothetical protein [Gordonia sp. (in: high G+C Gram-positive bacteria)]MCF3939726.1 hypothetical protein [Gordonia tangerina]MCX2962867.1 hypothetical protein [Gordonia aquimaris]MED5802657.1 hypothetical protein [Gordonia sp. Z-3]